MIFMDFAQTKPIQMRINNLELELLLRQELLLREIKIPLSFVFLMETKLQMWVLKTTYLLSMKVSLRPPYLFGMMKRTATSCAWPSLI